VNIVKFNSRQSGKVAAFIAHLQADKTHQIAYFGRDAAEIAAAIQTFDPPDNVLLAYENDRLIGLLGVDTDADSQRAWLYGPLVDHVDWQMVADALYDAVLRLNVIPTFVHDEELFVDAANINIADFAARHRFIPGTPQASLRLSRDVMQLLPDAADVSSLTEAQHQNFIRLHDMLFPKTYFSGQQIIQRLGERDKVFVVCAPEVEVIPIGYIYARIDPEATDGYIDFLGVVADFRRKGIAKSLLSAAITWLFSLSEIEAVALTVNAANSAALSLYASLGFAHLQTLQSYRKQY
jgi:ribosomal protein S18 acetylase RimI-like enzyme